MDSGSGLTSALRCRRMNEKWSDPEFNLESDQDNCLEGLVVDDDSEGSNIDALDLRHALGILYSAPDLINPLGTMSLPALGKVLERERPPPKSYPQSVHRVVSTFPPLRWPDIMSPVGTWLKTCWTAAKKCFSILFFKSLTRNV